MTMGNNNDGYDPLAWAIGYAAGYKLVQHRMNKQMEREERRVRKAQELAEWDARMALKAAEAERELERTRKFWEQQEKQDIERWGLTDKDVKFAHVMTVISAVIGTILGVLLFVAGVVFLLHILICAITGTPF